MLRKLSWVLALLALCSVPIVYSLGLGDISVHSGLNQPLSADIEIYSLRAREADNVKVLLGSDHDFASAGLQRPDYLDQLRFSVEPRGKQGFIIHVSTEQAVHEPLLDFLIQVTWPGGQLLREYTVSLSPPVLMEAPESATHQTFGAPLDETELATVKQEETPRPQAVAAAETLPSPQTAPAAEVKPEAAKSEVIAKAAPEVKPVAETPTKPEIIAKPSVIAEPAVIAKPAAAKPETASKPVVVAKREAITKPKAASKPKAVAKPAAAGSRTAYGPVRPGETLSVIANRAIPDQSLTESQKMQAILRANPAAFIDNNINKLKTGRILRLPSRSEISAINPQQALLDTRAQLDAWQRKQGIAVAAVLPAEKPVPAATAAEEQPAEEKTAKPTAVAEAPQAAAAPSGVPQLKLAPPTQESPQTAESGMGTGAQKEPAPDREAVAAGQLESQELNTRLAALEQQLTTMQKLMALKDQQLAAIQAENAATTNPLSNPDILLAIIGVLTAGLIAMLLITMRRPQAMLVRDIQPPSTPPAPRAATASAKPKPQAQHPAVHPSSEPSPETGINAEIDVYIAYGRYLQAESLIKETMVHDHSDELKLKLLEVYYAAKNAAAFEEAASNLREEVAADTELWRKVVPMGRELCPDSALFAAR